METLVFMSSPKNSGYQRGNVLGTPLRMEVVRRGVGGREGGGRGPGEGPKEVERVLDGGSGGESSSSEEEEEGVKLRIRGGGGKP